MTWRALLDDPRRLFRVFCLGAILCCAGVGTVLWADASLPPSLRQELVTAAAVIAIVAGLAIALTAHIALLIHRLRHAGRK